jgi:hypothetical protein
MKIIKKVKWALVSVWIFIVLIMVIGTIVIGRSYLSEMFGDGYSIQSLYSISDPIKETYRNLSIIMSEVQEDLQTNPNKFYDKKYFESLNRKLQDIGSRLSERRICIFRNTERYRGTGILVTY